MTAVYRLAPDNDRYHNFALENASEAAVFHRFDGRPIADWRPLTIHAVDTDDELAIVADHALLGTIPVFSGRAVQVIGNMLRQAGQLLPLVFERATYYAFNVITVVDALDEGSSQLTRFSSGRVMSVERFAFRPAVVSSHPIFKVPQLRADVFVTADFVGVVRHTQLTGFEFEEVWRT